MVDGHVRLSGEHTGYRDPLRVGVPRYRRTIVEEACLAPGRENASQRKRHESHALAAADCGHSRDARDLPPFLRSAPGVLGDLWSSICARFHLVRHSFWAEMTFFCAARWIGRQRQTACATTFPTFRKFNRRTHFADKYHISLIHCIYRYEACPSYTLITSLTSYLMRSYYLMNHR